MARGGFRLSIVEIVSAIVAIILVLAIILPVLQLSRASAHSTRCQNRLRQLASLFQDAQSKVGAKLRAENIGHHLDTYVRDIPDIWICPNKTGPGVSYGFNDRLHRLHVDDGHKIVALDYAQPIVQVTGLPVTDDWYAEVRPRHFGRCNVVFYDLHVDNLAPADIDPGSCESQLKYWMPTIDARLLADECDDATEGGE